MCYQQMPCAAPLAGAESESATSTGTEMNSELSPSEGVGPKGSFDEQRKKQLSRYYWRPG